MQSDLLHRAKSGDHDAFMRLVSAEMPMLRRIAKRMIGHPEDTEDVLQDAALKAWKAMSSFEERAAFRTWMSSIVTRTALDHLRAQKRWRARAQVAYANQCAGSETLSGEVMAAASDPDFAFEVKEHISYCFACVGRSLPPEEQAALVLCNVLDQSARDAASVLGISDSVLRHRLAAARRAMQDKFDDLCALVSKTGICHQCKGLSDLAGQDIAKDQFPDVADYADRMAIVRTAEPASMTALHDVFWRRTKEIEQADDSAVEPLTDCGTPDD